MDGRKIYPPEMLSSSPIDLVLIAPNTNFMSSIEVFRRIGRLLPHRPQVVLDTYDLYFYEFEKIRVIHALYWYQKFSGEGILRLIREERHGNGSLFNWI